MVFNSWTLPTRKPFSASSAKLLFRNNQDCKKCFGASFLSVITLIFSKENFSSNANAQHPLNFILYRREQDRVERGLLPTYDSYSDAKYLYCACFQCWHARWVNEMERSREIHLSLLSNSNDYLTVFWAKKYILLHFFSKKEFNCVKLG